MKNNLILRAMCLVATLFALSSNSLSAQVSTDLGTWTSLHIQKSWDKTYAMARLEHRSYDNISATECYFGMAGAGLKLNKWLNADLSYEYWKLPVAGNIDTYKAVASINGTLKRDALAVSLREKYELAFPEGGNAYGTLRSRLRAQYKTGVWTPYIMHEFFNGFNGTGWVRSLHYIGTEVKIADHSSLDLYYMYHLFPRGGAVAACNILGVCYILAL